MCIYDYTSVFCVYIHLLLFIHKIQYMSVSKLESQHHISVHKVVAVQGGFGSQEGQMSQSIGR